MAYNSQIIVQWFYSGYSGFYPLYLCQVEVFPKVGEDVKYEHWIERVTKMGMKKFLALVNTLDLEPLNLTQEKFFSFTV